MMNTVHIINAMEIGGVEVGVLSLLKSKINEDYKVITVKGCDEKLYRSLNANERSRLFVCNGYLNVFILLIRIKPQVIVSSLWRAHFVSLLFKIIKPNIKRVHFVHSTNFAHFVDKYISKISLYLSNYIFFDSNQSFNSMKNLIRLKPAFVIPMNVSFSNEKKTTCFDPINFVYVGRFGKEKNLFTAIKYIKLLNSYGLPSTLDLYGRDDGELKNLKKYVMNADLANLVTFHDSILPNKIETEMKKYNFYLQTSLFEGMSISVYQSIKNGLLPVVTPVGEIPKYTINGVNAFYLDLNYLNDSAKLFIDSIRSGKIQNYDVGHIVNKKNYPEFDCSFFSKVDEILTSIKNNS